MIKQERFIDDNEGTGVEKFLYDVVEKYELKRFCPSVEIRYRGVNFGMLSNNHATDDKIAQLVVENRLVALAFMRRDDLNYTEVSYVVFEDAIERCKEFVEKINTFQVRESFAD